MHEKQRKKLFKNIYLFSKTFLASFLHSSWFFMYTTSRINKCSPFISDSNAKSILVELGAAICQIFSFAPFSHTSLQLDKIILLMPSILAIYNWHCKNIPFILLLLFWSPYKQFQSMFLTHLQFKGWVRSCHLSDVFSPLCFTSTLTQSSSLFWWKSSMQRTL